MRRLSFGGDFQNKEFSLNTPLVFVKKTREALFALPL
jgi:hypothetical protein